MEYNYIYIFKSSIYCTGCGVQLYYTILYQSWRQFNALMMYHFFFSVTETRRFSFWHLQ